MAKHDEWETPQTLFNLLDAEFLFTLDAAASESNHKGLIPSIRYLTKATDALTNQWRRWWQGEAVWCNPPYSQLPAFVARAWDQAQANKGIVVMLIPAYTDTKYWHEIIKPYASEIRFLKGRLSYELNGKPQGPARFPSAVVIFDCRDVVRHKPQHIWFWDWKEEL